jgi:hypothetical protein
LEDPEDSTSVACSVDTNVVAGRVAALPRRSSRKVLNMASIEAAMLVFVLQSCFGSIEGGIAKREGRGGVGCKERRYAGVDLGEGT